jgi:hypothetical protein
MGAGGLGREWGRRVRVRESAKIDTAQRKNAHAKGRSKASIQWVAWALFLSPRQRSLQYNTLSQFLAQLLRQVMVRPQTVQGFSGKCCLLPLKPEGLGMVFSNEKGLA